MDLLGDEYLVEFINDTMSFYLRQQKIAFLSKYAEMLQGAHNIVPLREFLVDLVKMSLRKTHRASALDDYKQSVAARFAEEGFEPD